MIKKIIFDVDNTLMMFDKQYVECYQEVLKKNNYPCHYEDGLKIYQSIGRYEDTVQRYEREKLLNFINDDLKTSYTLQVIDDLIDIIGNKWINKVDSYLVDILEYLSSKYELNVLTNWFTESQTKRLENVGIAKYFKEIVGSDISDIKPNPNSYLYFTKDALPNECLMIGDRIETDIQGALDVGMHALLYDYKHQYQDTGYDTFIEWQQFKDIV